MGIVAYSATTGALVTTLTISGVAADSNGIMYVAVMSEAFGATPIGVSVSDSINSAYTHEIATISPSATVVVAEQLDIFLAQNIVTGIDAITIKWSSVSTGVIVGIVSLSDYVLHAVGSVNGA